LLLISSVRLAWLIIALMRRSLFMPQSKMNGIFSSMEVTYVIIWRQSPKLGWMGEKSSLLTLGTEQTYNTDPLTSFMENY